MPPNQGRSPELIRLQRRRQSLASHQAAKPLTRNEATSSDLRQRDEMLECGDDRLRTPFVFTRLALVDFALAAVSSDCLAVELVAADLVGMDPPAAVQVLADQVFADPVVPDLLVVDLVAVVVYLELMLEKSFCCSFSLSIVTLISSNKEFDQRKPDPT